MKDQIVRIDRVNAYVEWLQKQPTNKPIEKTFAFDMMFGDLTLAEHDRAVAIMSIRLQDAVRKASKF